MNTANNQRFQETEERIVNALLGLLGEGMEPEKITVRRICEACGINRSSFYLHFVDVVDLMVKIDRRYAEAVRGIFTAQGHHWNIGERFAYFFQFVRDHRAFYEPYLAQCPDIHLLSVTLTERELQGIQQISRERGFRSEGELRYHQAFFRAGIAAILRAWIAGGCAESPEEMADILAREYVPDKGSLQS